MPKIFFLAILLTLAGCKSIVVQSEAEAFRLCHPQLQKMYVRLEPTSIFMMEAQLFTRRSQSRMAIDTIRDISPTNSPLIEHMEKVGAAIYEDFNYPISLLQKEQARWGGSIYFCELKSGVQGYVLIANGEIRARAPLAEGLKFP